MMKMRNQDLDRLFQSAASAPDEPAPEAPFGFDTRVIALWHAASGGTNSVADLTPFLRRIGAMAFVVFLLAGLGFYRQQNENEARTAPQSYEYLIADSEIQTQFSP